MERLWRLKAALYPESDWDLEWVSEEVLASELVTHSDSDWATVQVLGWASALAWASVSVLGSATDTIHQLPHILLVQR
jgi:hypothetical protein